VEVGFRLAVAVAAVAAVGLSAALFIAAALLDEDVNHWSWPHDSGPGKFVTAVHAAGSLAFGILMVVGVASWLRSGRVVWTLLSLAALPFAALVLSWPGPRYSERRSDVPTRETASGE
jgi:hypothetical protein